MNDWASQPCEQHDTLLLQTERGPAARTASGPWGRCLLGLTGSPAPGVPPLTIATLRRSSSTHRALSPFLRSGDASLAGPWPPKPAAPWPGQLGAHPTVSTGDSARAQGSGVAWGQLLGADQPRAQHLPWQGAHAEARRREAPWAPREVPLSSRSPARRATFQPPGRQLQSGGLSRGHRCACG